MSKQMQPHQIRSHCSIGREVLVILKEDQSSGMLTRGVIKEILTDSKTHPRGIKVRILGGQVGRVQDFVK